MLGIYFSGTGNSKYALEIFLGALDPTAKAFSIEDSQVLQKVRFHDDIVFSYPVQYSSVPKILQDFVLNNHSLWLGKRVFIIATMGLFSGDGAGVLGRLLEHCGADVTGGLHLKMPDSIADEKVLKRSLEENTRLIRQAEEKLKAAAVRVKSGDPPQEGIGFLPQIAGLFGQRLYFGYKTRKYHNGLKIDPASCVKCGKCVKLCPMDNITLNGGSISAGDRCTLCYRCVNYCPRQAITLLGSKVICQTQIEHYINNTGEII